MASSATFLSSENDVEQQPVNFIVQVIGRENVTLKEMQILRIVIMEKKKFPGGAANRFRQVVSLPTYGTLRSIVLVVSPLNALEEVLHASRDLIATVTTPPSCMPGQNNMAAVVSDRVPSLRGYRDSLSAENRAIYDAKLKLTANIDPYSVSANVFAQSMVKWPEIEFPDIVNYLLFSIKQVSTKEQVKAYKSLQAYQYVVAGWMRSIYVGNAT